MGKNQKRVIQAKEEGKTNKTEVEQTTDIDVIEQLMKKFDSETNVSETSSIKSIPKSQVSIPISEKDIIQQVSFSIIHYRMKNLKKNLLNNKKEFQDMKIILTLLLLKIYPTRF